MSFANPAFLWGLLSLIPLAAIYLLKVRPVRKPTTAWFLWEDILKQRKATSLFERLRDLFSLLLMAAAFAAIVFAMARPSFSTDQKRDLILLIDNSASMSAAGAGTTRLQQAKSTAKEIVQGLGGSQRCSIGSLSDSLQFQANLSDNPRELLLGIDKIQPSSLSGDPRLLSQLLNSRTDEAEEDKERTSDSSDDSNPRIVLISDGCFNDPIPDGVELLKVDGGSGNIGIVACDMRYLPGGTNRLGVFFQVASSFSENGRGRNDAWF